MPDIYTQLVLWLLQLGACLHMGPSDKAGI